MITKQSCTVHFIEYLYHNRTCDSIIGLLYGHQQRADATDDNSGSQSRSRITFYNITSTHSKAIDIVC